MTTKQDRINRLLYLKRFFVVLVSTIIVIWLANEVVYFFQKADTDRAPMTVEILIPEGTAERIAADDPTSDLPDDMVFVLGDTLVVNNQDIASHELGPIFVPPQTSASMRLDTADRYTLSCSFTPSRYFGLNVKKPTTTLTRLVGLLYAVPPTTLLFFFYSLVVKPVGVLPADEIIKESKKVENL